MANLEEIREGIHNVISANLPDMMIYEYPEDVQYAPCIVVQLAPGEAATFDGSMQMGTCNWNFDLSVLVGASTDKAAAQRDLDQYIDSHGELSLREIFFKNADLGLGSDVDSFVANVRGYGGGFWEQTQVKHIGAVVRLTVCA